MAELFPGSQEADLIEKNGEFFSPFCHPLEPPESCWRWPACGLHLTGGAEGTV